ncbi:DNA cytosine methyltransferase [Mesorhizobium xinjiangense]|uniref:DNA cytosine methyltransferase n=1 Tax=Mesorhizobium xinjiangense TaxID=2678685 RepID=UPI0018DEC613|nr:DNA cytosine methyltransferase [Mesorhizobium xinjiangense]
MKVLFEDDSEPSGPPRSRWRCLPCPGRYPAAKVPVPSIPPAKNGARKIVVADGFAGGGGATNGIEAGLEQLHAMELLPAGHPLHVTYAMNHDDAAIAMHKVNHPRTIHLPANVWQVSMREMLGDDLFGLLWLSPDCRDHSPAKGGPITSRAVRDLAWVAIKYLKELPAWQRPWIICLENVSAFAKWSPLIERPDGQGYMRDPDRLGWTFHQFVHALSRYGYSIGWKEVVACDHGAPTIRKRLKLVARRDGLPVEWPEATHGDPKSEAVKSGALKPWPVAADILDWSEDCPSIFMTKEEAREYTKRTGKRIIRPLVVKTHARLAYGVKRHVLDAGDDAFVVTCNHAGDGFRGQGLGKPFATVARARDAHGLVVPHVAVFRGDSSGKPVTDTMPTVTANSFINRPGGASPLGLVEAAISPFVSRGQHGGGNRPATEPVHTIAASDGDQNQIVVPYLVPRYGERDGQAPRSVGVDRPAPTPVPDGNQGSLAAVYLAQHNNDSRRVTGVNPGRPAGKPLSTITHEASQQQVVAASMLSLKGSDRRDGSCEDPHPAVCASGQHSAVVTLPLMTAYYSTGGQHARVDSPSLTVPTKARFGLTEVDAAMPPLSSAQWARARQVAAFLRAHGCWDGGEIVTLTIRGTVFIIVDIGMRMLKPRELARAQGFPDSYVLDPIFNGKPLSETEQRHKIGNSVCEKPAAAVIVSNYRPPLEWGEQAAPFMEAAE